MHDEITGQYDHWLGRQWRRQEPLRRRSRGTQVRNEDRSARRVDETFDDPASANAVAQFQDEVMKEAEKCAAAEWALAAADTDAEMSLSFWRTMTSSSAVS